MFRGRERVRYMCIYICLYTYISECVYIYIYIYLDHVHLAIGKKGSV